MPEASSVVQHSSNVNSVKSCKWHKRASLLTKVELYATHASEPTPPPSANPMTVPIPLNGSDFETEFCCNEY